MSKFEELCQAYAEAKQRTELSHQACRQFLEDFMINMREYFQAPIDFQNESFDDQGVMHFEIALTIYADPNDPDNSYGEKVLSFWSVEKILDNYILTIYPWMKQFQLFEKEWDKFEAVYKYIFEIIRENYFNQVPLSEQERIKVRRLDWFDE